MHLQNHVMLLFQIFYDYPEVAPIEEFVYYQKVVNNSCEWSLKLIVFSIPLPICDIGSV